MSKAHRGSGIRKLANHGRGTCPVCKTQAIKLLYDQEIDGAKVKICKFCRAAFKNKAAAEAKLAKRNAVENAVKGEQADLAQA